MTRLLTLLLSVLLVLDDVSAMNGDACSEGRCCCTSETTPTPSSERDELHQTCECGCSVAPPASAPAQEEPRVQAPTSFVDAVSPCRTAFVAPAALEFRPALGRVEQVSRSFARLFLVHESLLR